ncbi:hypothetical protein J3R30DRAFT_3831356 [Lentinula aciculospora]|uniref:Uncharacterized protein n=1 Tax=Lentinula aciculospora TaxID=153920 RepID=A0A9W8ZXX6_9AGAR|nr:hypothetical protein J3R30DRAFT_3831356 [Lentinula aciculospora]
MRMRPILAHFLASRYEKVKLENPGKGRRYWQLRVLHEFWASNPPKPRDNEPTEAPSESALNDYTQDDDPCDVIVSDAIGGLIIRTNFSNEEAWNIFIDKLKAAEVEISGGGQETTEAGPSSEPTAFTDVDMRDQDESDESEDETEGKLIKVVNPAQPEERAIFEQISNIRALRLFNDVDIRPAPPVPSGSKRISPPNPLIDFAGWQEIYTGVTLWVYDSKSNVDQSARLVSLEGDIYGTATGDSWRAQASHIPDLQLNMTFENMKINFGGMDRWDYSERKRNLAEAGILEA